MCTACSWGGPWGGVQAQAAAGKLRYRECELQGGEVAPPFVLWLRVCGCWGESLAEQEQYDCK